MTIFVIFRVTVPAKLKAAIAANFENDHLELGNNEWLISSNMTPQPASPVSGVLFSRWREPPTFPRVRRTRPTRFAAEVLPAPRLPCHPCAGTDRPSAHATWGLVAMVSGCRSESMHRDR